MCFVDPIAAGSGIPEMKTIISYDLRSDADRFLKLRTLVAKSTGLTLALGSNISVGREGPFVHIASIIAHILMKHVPFFQRIYRNDILRHHMYNAACAVGVATTFQAPIGGVLFAIEVTSTTFMVSNYWRAFVAALSGSITRQVVRIVQEADTSSYAPMFPTKFPEKSFQHAEFVAFALLGVLMGLAGAVYVALSSAFKVRWQAVFATHPLSYGFVLLLAICGLMYAPGEFGQLSSSQILLDLWSVGDLSSQWHSGLSSLFWMLPIAALCRLVATMFSTSLPLPAGDFIPTFIAGTMLGRLYGEILHYWFPQSGILAGGYAFAGGAAFTGAATHTISVAGSYIISYIACFMFRCTDILCLKVIAIEFTGQFVYTTPLLLAVLCASSLASALSVSVYDMTIRNKGLMYLPNLRVNDLDDVAARDVMILSFPVLTLETTLEDLQQILQAEPSPSIPVVDDLERMVFHGCVRRDAIVRLVADLNKIHEQDPAYDASADVSEDIELRSASLALGDNQMIIESPSATLDPHVISLRRSEYVRIDASVLQVDADARLTKVHLYFDLIKCSRIWVTRRGKLVGLIHRHRLHSQVTELRKQQHDINKQHRKMQISSTEIV